MNFEIKEIIESAATNLPNLFGFSTFGILLKEEATLYFYQEESCPLSFSQEVVKNMIKVFSILGEAEIDIDRVSLKIEKRKLMPTHMAMEPQATLKSHLTLPLSVEKEIIGCISLSSDQPNAFDAQDLQFLSVIGYQMAATLKHFQRFSSVKHIAIYDTLTNLYNRRYFEERFGVEAQKAFYSGTFLSLGIVDIDHFKKVNDTLGHPAGDKVLYNIASLLKNSVRKKDTVARYGGEEFILILPEANLEASFMIAERIRQLIEKTSIAVGETQLHLTVSIGISSFPTHRAKSKEELIKMADRALYEAKAGGRNRVCMYHHNPKANKMNPF